MPASGEKLARYGFETYEAGEAWLHGAQLQGWSHIYEPVKPGPFNGSFRVAWLGPLQVIHERVEHPFRYCGRPWPGARVLMSFLTGSCGLLCNGRPVEADSVVAHRWDKIEHFSCCQRIEVVLVAIDERFLQEQLTRDFEQALFASHAGPVVVAQGAEHVVTFQQTLLGILDELSRSPGALDSRQAQRAMQRRALNAMASVATVRAARGLPLPPPSTRAYIVDTAIEFMGNRLADPISITDICEKLRVCPRTLGYSFNTVLGVSPTRLLLAMRLSRVRRDLAAASPGASIQAIAARWGFWHMGRFAQQYRRAFGERPSDTCRQAALRSRSAAVTRLAPGARAARYPELLVSSA